MQSPSELRIQWYPGHMAKARRELEAGLSLVDVVIEVIDARAPASSTNPDLQPLVARKKRLRVLTKIDLADPALTPLWLDHLRSEGTAAHAVDLKAGTGLAALRRALARLSGRRMLVVGIPNTGKSSLINRLAVGRKARAGSLPGVTRGQQWVRGAGGLLLDTPGLLWPRLSDHQISLHLAWLDCIGAAAYDEEEVALALAAWLQADRAAVLRARFGLDEDPPSPVTLLDLVGRARGALLTGGVVDRRRAAAMLLKEFRAGRLGPVTLEAPPA